MELKVVVSLLIIYIYIFLKTRGNINSKGKHIWLNYDLLFLLTPFIYFIKNDLGKMAIFIILSVICTLIYIYKNKNQKIKKNYKLKTSIILLINLIPLLIYLILGNIKYLVGLYVIMSVLCYFNHYIVKSINMIEKKFIKHKK